MEDVSSPTHAFFDFDFSEFIDKNFDIADEFNSPNDTKSTPSSTINDLTSCENIDVSNSMETKVNNYTHEDPNSCPLWSRIEDLVDKAPPTLSCIDDFIKDPHSDLVQLVQQCQAERALFENLITHSLADNASVTPLDILHKREQEQEQQQLQQKQQQQRKQQVQQYQQMQMQYQQQFHQLQLKQNFSPYILHQPIPQHPLDGLAHHIQNSPLEQHLYLQHIQEQQQQQSATIPPQPKKKKSSASAGQKRVSKSSSYSSNNSSYTHSDSVNAQLLRELIRQAGRSNASRNNSMDSSNSSVTSNNSSLAYPPPVVDYQKEIPYYSNNGNYQPSQHYRHHPYYPSTSPTSRHNLPYQTQTKKPAKSIPNQHKNAGIPPNRIKTKHHPMGRPSMYSSDISQAQLLEIQAISRAQQDFIRAREQQEAEKELMLKQKKQLGI